MEKDRAAGLKPKLLSPQVNAVSRDALTVWGATPKTHNEQSAGESAKLRIRQARTSTKTKVTQFLALANRNAKAGVNPNPGTD
jgi:hypothetical protein